MPLLNELGCVVRVNPADLKWPMRLRASSELDEEEKARVADMNAKVPDWNQEDHRFTMLEFYDHTLNAVKASPRHAAPHIVDPEIDANVLNDTWDLDGVVEQLQSFPFEMQELFFASILRMNGSGSNDRHPFLPGLYRPLLNIWRRCMGESVPTAFIDEARLMCLQAGSEKPPEAGEIKPHLITDRCRRIWLKEATPDDIMALGYIRLERSWCHVLRREFPDSLDESMCPRLRTAEAAKRANALKLSSRLALSLNVDHTEEKEVARRFLGRYSLAVSLFSSFTNGKSPRKVIHLKREFQELFRTLDDVRRVHSFIHNKHDLQETMITASDEWSLRIVKTLLVSVSLSHESFDSEEAVADPLATHMIVEHLRPVLDPLDGRLHSLDDTPPDTWTKPRCPPMKNIYCAGSMAVILIEVHGIKVFLVHSNNQTKDGEQPRHTAQEFCQRSAWFATAGAATSRAPKRKSAAGPSAEGGNSKRTTTNKKEEVSSDEE